MRAEMLSVERVWAHASGNALSYAGAELQIAATHFGLPCAQLFSSEVREWLSVWVVT